MNEENNIAPVNEELNVVKYETEDIKNLIYNLQKDIPNVKTNLFGAIKRSSIKGWKN